MTSRRFSIISINYEISQRTKVGGVLTKPGKMVHSPCDGLPCDSATLLNSYAVRQRLFGAALRVFSEVGYTKATTKRIAAAASLRSPGLIYWYFPNKAALLLAVVERFAVLLRTGTTQESPPPDAEPDDFLRRLALAGLAFFESLEVRQVYRLFMSEWPLLERLGVSLRNSQRPDNVYAFLERYLRGQVERGGLRPHNTEAAARSFVSQIWSQVEARHLFPTIYPEPPDDEAFVADLVDMFLGGLLPRD